MIGIGKAVIAAAVCACVGWVAAFAGTASASTPSAGWSIRSTAQPTSFSVDDSRNQVERLTVLATGGQYELSGLGGVVVGPIPWNATSEELQKAIEAVPALEASGIVKVEGTSATSTEHAYTITWIGRSPGTLLEERTYTETHLVNGSGAGEVRHETVQTNEAHDRYTLVATNVGSRAAEGEITVSDVLPAGLVASEMEIEEPRSSFKEGCRPAALKCTYTGEPIRPGGSLIVRLHVAVPLPSLTGLLVNQATVMGGRGEASASQSNSVNTGPAPFGLEQVGFQGWGLDGLPDAQADDHPYQFTMTVGLNTVRVRSLVGAAGKLFEPSQEVKDVTVEMPLGFAGDPLAAERCPESDLAITYFAGHTACPAASVVGAVELVLEGGLRSYGIPLYNVAPERGYPAELGFSSPVGLVFLYATIVPTPNGYRLRISAPGVLRGTMEESSITLFGEPGQHNGSGDTTAFATNPTNCSAGPLNVRVEATSWEGGSDAREATAYKQITGCDLLQGTSPFSPTVTLQPEETHADNPSGYEVDLKVPQAPNVFGQLATPELKDASVTLPPGLSLSPSAASGPNSLEGCTPDQIDLLGTELGEGHPGGNGSPYDDGLTHASPGHCPAKSQIGDVELKTPLLEEPLRGHVYLASPTCGGQGQPQCTAASASNGELFGLYLELSGSGVIIKLHGQVSVDPQTGQVTTTFADNPQMPFESLRMTLYGGQRASLANPQTCGAAQATSRLVPWSTPATPTATPSSTPYEVTGCAPSMPFAPGFSAGTVVPVAGGLTPFTLTVTRNDGEQDLGGVSVTLPPGLSGMVSKVPECDEVDANAGTCPESARVGTAHIAAGAGSEPLWLEGPVYFTGPYHGAPFGLSVVVPTKAGPFNLGKEVVRSAISIDPHTAQVTATSDPLRLIRDGIPFRLKTVNVTIDRPGFMFNPTNCIRRAVTARVTGDLPDGSAGATASVGTPFAVAGCRNLPFKPRFSVQANAKHSRGNGVSVHVTVQSAPGQANVGTVHVEVPKILPSRLSTLNQACTEAQFATNPAGCPAGSFVGTATAHTPILPGPISGPAIFVSHGGAAFPNLDLVLQGDGVTIVLVGDTFIDKSGVTSSTFSSVPDVPVQRFDLDLPEGPHSALSASGDLCAAQIVMPTVLTGQNGAQVRQRTKVKIAGCKAAIRVLRSSVHGHTATIVVTVPSAGRLLASGVGLSRFTRHVGKAGKLSFSLTLSASERRFLARHPGRRLKTRLHLRFTAMHGGAISTGLTLLMG